MPPARRGPAPLTDEDVARLRGALATGSEPRVQLLVDTPAAPAGTRGPVVALRDPGVEPEFIVLRVGGDELPFGPRELTWPVRAARGGREAVPPAADPVVAEPVAAGPEAAGPVTGVAGEPVVTEPAAGVMGEPVAPEPSGAEPAAPGDQPPTPDPRPRRTRASGGAAGGVQPFTVTLRFTGTDWTSETTRGGRRGKARPLPVAAVRGLAERLDDPELRRALLTAVDACRDQARARAERLRAELEQVETVLAQLDDED